MNRKTCYYCNNYDEYNTGIEYSYYEYMFCLSQYISTRYWLYMTCRNSGEKKINGLVRSRSNFICRRKKINNLSRINPPNIIIVYHERIFPGSLSCTFCSIYDNKICTIVNLLYSYSVWIRAS